MHAARPRHATRHQLPRNTARATSFVGTAEYVSPEVLCNSGVSYASDLWALGCIVYQLLAGAPPFKGGSEYLTFQLISARTLSFPDGFPAAGRDLVERLLQLEPAARLGERARGAAGCVSAAVRVLLLACCCRRAEACLRRQERPAWNSGLRANAHSCTPLRNCAPDKLPLALLLAPPPLYWGQTGAKSLEELQAHPFFAGVDWAAVRDAPAPRFVPPPAPPADDLGLDWELSSLFRSAAPPLKYEYLPPGAAV